MQTLRGSVRSQIERRTAQLICHTIITCCVVLAVTEYAAGHHICSVAMCKVISEAHDGALVGAQVDSTLLEGDCRLRDTLQASWFERSKYDAGQCKFAAWIMA